MSAAFRVKLDLYANVRPARSRAGLGRPMDLVIMRECTEGFYPDRNMHQGSGEFMPVPGVALSVRKITAHACERIARRAFELARKRKKLVTAVHKANVFRVTDGLYLDTVRAVAKEFPDVKLEEEIVDAMAAKLVRHPERYDVVLATNFYADILSDLASELSGSLGLAGSVNAGETLCAAQAQHGSAPDIAGQDKANPTSLILSAAMLLEWLGAKRNDANLRAGWKSGRSRDRYGTGQAGNAHRRPRRQARHARLRRGGRQGDKQMILGSGKHRYRVLEDWAKLPDGWEFKDVAAVAVDSKDHVYVFNRGEHPMIVFDRDGNFLRSWGEGTFPRAHGLHIDANDIALLHRRRRPHRAQVHHRGQGAARARRPRASPRRT